MFKTLVTLFILFASPLIVGASVPTDVGNTLIQRTPYDTYSKYAKWCTSFSDLYDSDLVVPWITADVNGLPYWSVGSSTSFGDNTGSTFVFDHSDNCNNKSPYFQTPPAQSFMPDMTSSYNFYVIWGVPNGNYDDVYSSGTSSSLTTDLRWYSWDGDDILSPNDYRIPSSDRVSTTTTKVLPYLGTTYGITKITNFALATSSATNPTNNSGVPAEMDLKHSSSYYGSAYAIYAIVYSSTDLYAEIVTPADLVDYIEYLNTGIYNPNTPTTPTSVATNTIYQIQSPAYASVYSLGTRSTTTVRFQYTYGIADTTFDYASIELYNLTSGITYNTPQQSIVMSGLNTYTTYLTLPAGNYTWRPYLHATSSNLYQNNGSWFTFTIAGNTTEWWGSYSVATDTLATSTTWFDTTWGTSTFTLGTTTYDFSDINLDLLDFGSGVCGVNMSCFIPFCIDFPNLCNRFPFAYAVDIFSILNVWSGIFQTGAEIDQVTFDYDSGYGTGTITMLDLSEGTIARQLADKVRYFSSLIVWLSFGFWAFALTGKILS